MKRKDILIIVLVAALAGGLLLVSGQLSGSRNGQAGGRLPAVTVTEPPAGQTPAPQAAQPDADGEGADAALPVPTLAPAQAYLSVQIDQLVYDPIPLLEDNMLELTQADGKADTLGNTKGQAVCVYRPGWVVGYRRRVAATMDYLPYYDAYQMVATVRLAFARLDTDVSSVLYNISV